MKWERKGTMGLICEPYSIGKYLVGDHLEYRVWFNDELIAECKTFEECELVIKRRSTSADF